MDVGLLDPSSAFNSTANPGLGVFMYRSANGTGTNTWTGAKLQWNYGINSVADNTMVEIQVCAIEMVYVPTGTFSIGSGGSETSAFYKYPTTTNTYSVSSENAITIGTATNNLYYAPPPTAAIRPGLSRQLFRKDRVNSTV